MRKAGAMRHLAKLAAAALSALALAACVQTDLLIRVNPDGSGTMEETILLSKDAAAQIRSTFESLARVDAEDAPGEGRAEQEEGLEEKAERPGGPGGPAVELWKEDEVAARATTMGEGVEFVGMEFLDTGDYEGYRAVFSFADINKLLVNQNPGEAVPQEPAREGKHRRELIRFKFAGGETPTLTIVQPAGPEAPAAQEAPEKGPGAEGPGAEAEAEKTPEQLEQERLQKEQEAQQQAMVAELMRAMLAGMRISVEVEVAGEIVQSNAAYREGSRVTLMELDFDRLIADAGRFEKFIASQGGTIESAKALMKELPGVKVDLNEEVVVRFR